MGGGQRPRYRAGSFMVPVGAVHGWEAAVYDHFSAVAAAIGSKLAAGKARSAAQDVVGGATHTFDVHEGHPYRERVMSLLSEHRASMDALFAEVRAYNERHPADEAARSRVTFYYGQYVVPAEPNERAQGGQ